MKIALLQVNSSTDIGDNLCKGITACAEAKKKGADIALFPEMWSNGYHITDNIETMNSEAVCAESDFVNAFANCAAYLNMAIGLTILEQYDTAPKNTLIVFDRNGKKVLKYSKVHTCDFDLERNLQAGDDFYVADLDTAEGIVKIGAMICYDREFPESARILMLKGAEVILVPNACPMELNRLSQLRTRAFENMVGVATCNYPSGHSDCNGHSSAFDGIAWLPDSDASRDMCVLQADEEEGVYIAELNIHAMRMYRSREVFGNAYRHPNKYKEIVRSNIQEPFIRKDYRK